MIVRYSHVHVARPFPTAHRAVATGDGPWASPSLASKAFRESTESMITKGHLARTLAQLAISLMKPLIG